MQTREENDHYATLGADEAASQDEIERLYKRLAVRHHPDRGGDEERMKSLNEAYRVLGNADERRGYDDARRESRRDSSEVRRSGIGRARVASAADFGTTYAGVSPHRSPSAQADVLGGRLLGAWLCVLAGLVLLLLVRFHYVRFLWPLALLAGAVVLMGVMMAHGALAFARRVERPGNPLRRFVWAQELVFWAGVCAGAYGVYLILTAI